jgi:hypothetical protein
MAIITEVSWDQFIDGHFPQSDPTRQIWHDAVAEIAEKAKQTLPECNGRVDRAVKIVLAGDVELLQDGTAKVFSQSHGTTKYFIVNGVCSCKDYNRAPSNWCVHKIAAGLAKRARTLAKTKLEQLQSASNGTTQPATEQSQVQPQHEPVEAPVESEPVVSSVALPEAPASVNCHIMLEGRQIQVTLRDTDETRLLARLATLLQQYPVAQPPTEPPTQSTGSPAPDENPYCHLHKAVLKRFSKDGRTWYSHKTPNGSWCRGK